MHPDWILDDICDALGYSRQAYYKRLKAASVRGLEEAIVVKLVAGVRQDMPRLGTRKLYYLLTASLLSHKIDMGRDRLFELLSTYDLLIRRRKRRKPLTTDSNHPYRKYPNRVRDLVPEQANQLWVSDITYIAIPGGYCYLSLITDVYSHKIVGWCLWENLKRDGTILALKMALNTLAKDEGIGLIHHSDRGMQYCSADYTDLLIDNKIRISMTEKGDPYENAVAERVNGILKGEFGLGERLDSWPHADKITESVIKIYNTQRPHASCDYLTPEEAHTRSGILPKRWGKKKKKEVTDAQLV